MVMSPSAGERTIESADDGSLVEEQRIASSGRSVGDVERVEDVVVACSDADEHCDVVDSDVALVELWAIGICCG